jgi:hypothetical protein
MLTRPRLARVTPWAKSDDMPTDHAVAVVESNGPTANGGRSLPC